jgi:ArsR family transcriptional regulator
MTKNNIELDQLSDFLKVVSEENRLKIIRCLQKSEERCVCEIQEFLDLPQNLISHHLKVLRDFDLLESKKDGLKVYYRIKQDKLSQYNEVLSQLLSKGEV